EEHLTQVLDQLIQHADALEKTGGDVPAANSGTQPG
ncbi:MAG: hypothetical protein ACI8PQ_000723, partial [Planctomycetota bacterium]